MSSTTGALQRKQTSYFKRVVLDEQIKVSSGSTNEEGEVRYKDNNLYVNTGGTSDDWVGLIGAGGGSGTSGTSGTDGLLPDIGNDGELLFRDTGSTYGYNTSDKLIFMSTGTTIGKSLLVGASEPSLTLHGTLPVFEVSGATKIGGISYDFDIEGFGPSIRQVVKRVSNTGLAFDLFNLYAERLGTSAGTEPQGLLGKVGIYGNFSSNATEPYSYYMYIGVNKDIGWNDAWFKIDYNKRISISPNKEGSGYKPVNTLDVGGNVVIGNDLSCSVTAPTNGLRVEGNVIFESKLDVQNQIKLSSGNTYEEGELRYKDNSLWVNTGGTSDGWSKVGENTVEQVDFEINIETGKTYILSEYSFNSFTVNNLVARTSTGSTDVTFFIGSTSITGLSGITVTNSQSTFSATANNTLSVGGRLSMRIDDFTSYPIIYGSLKMTKT